MVQYVELLADRFESHLNPTAQSSGEQKNFRFLILPPSNTNKTLGNLTVPNLRQHFVFSCVHRTARAVPLPKSAAFGLRPTAKKSLTALAQPGIRAAEALESL